MERYKEPQKRTNIQQNSAALPKKEVSKPPRPSERHWNSAENHEIPRGSKTQAERKRERQREKARGRERGRKGEWGSEKGREKEVRDLHENSRYDRITRTTKKKKKKRMQNSVKRIVWRPSGML